MGGHLGGQPETSDDQHHTTAPGADEPDITPRARRQIRRQIDVGAPDEPDADGMPGEPLDEWTRRQIEKLWYGFRQHGDDIAGIQAHLEAWNENLPGELLESRNMRLTEDRIVEHAIAQGWPVAACGESCGFIATAPDNAVGPNVYVLLDTHQCANAKPPAPSLTRLVVGCATFLIFVLMVGAFIEDIMGVK